mgnify:CR=1 FL=1
MNYKEHLKRQLAFLERSCIAYDQGYIDEAIRMATVIRVLLHKTHRSTSLLAHLGREDINLLNTAGEEPNPNVVMYYGLGIYCCNNTGGEYIPNLYNSFDINYLPFNTWWNQIVYVLSSDIRISRKKIILDAANKDGGAHVDLALSDEYEKLSEVGALGVFTSYRENMIEERPIDNAHLVGIRQIAYELLNSPELLTLID